MSNDPSVLRAAIGPSPWAFYNHSVKINNDIFLFKDLFPGDKSYSGLIALYNSKNEILLVQDFYNYARILDDGTTLLWRAAGDISFDCCNITNLCPINNPKEIAQTMREKKISISPIPNSENWTIFPYLQIGVRHRINNNYKWERFEETLVLANYEISTDQKKMSRAILVFNWIDREVEVFPQEWFNNGNYDFGYQWITRVARRSDGKIVGDGIRLGSFELDNTNRNIEKWNIQNPFYMIK